MSELFGENDGIYGSHLLQDDSCTIGEHNHMRRIDEGTPDDEDDNFCKKAVSSPSKSCRGIPRYDIWSPGMSELFGENDGMYGSHLV